MIRLHALGAVELRRSDGTEVGSVIAQPKRLALLVYLAAARPRGFHRRDTLIGLFWPESTEARARGSLGQALYFLRHALGNDVVIGRGNDEVAVSEDRLWSDAAAVHDAMKAGRAEEALELYRGDLLPGFFLPGARGFEEWIDRERGRLRRAVLDAASVRAAELEHSDPRVAAELMRRALGVAPDEAMLRRLMTLLDGDGDRAGALAAYDEVARRLAVEIEIDPAPETLALRQKIAARITPAHPGTAPRIASLVPRDPGPASRDGAPVLSNGGQRSPAPARGASQRWRGKRRLAALLLVAAAAVAMSGLWPHEAREQTAGAVPRFTLAVAPFTAATRDTGVLRIAREVVVPLSANLDGLGDVRSVEGMNVLAASGPGEAAAAALEVARRLGATRVLHGAIVSAGPGLRVDATMRRVADGRAILRVTVATERDASVLADSLTWAVLHELWRSRGAAADSGISPPVPAEPALGTRSLPALRAYWEGERATSQDRWRDAAEHFARAFALDSAYWFAYWRYGYARSTVEAAVEPRIRETYETHRFEFPDRDRLLIEARMADSLSDRLARHRAVTRSFPDYWQGWWDYANRLVHDGPFLGATREDAREALERTLALRPNDVIVMQHLFWLAAADADVGTMEQVVRRTRQLRAASPGFEPARPDYLLLFDMTLAAAHADQAALARAMDHNVADLIESIRGPAGDVFSLGPAAYGFYGGQIQFNRRMLESTASPALKAAQRRGLALTWAARGAWDSAMVAARGYVTADAGPVPRQHMLRLAVAGEWLRALPHGAADPWRAALNEYEDRLDPRHRAELVWLDGILAAARNSAHALAAARRRLRALGAADPGWDGPPALPRATATPNVNVLPRMLDASLAAFELASRNDARSAGEALVELERQRAEHGWVKAPAQWHPYLTGLNRLAAARWLRQSGRPDRVDRLLAWSDAVEVPAYLASEAGMVLSGAAYYERALAAEALGRGDDAQRHYARFLRRNDMPVPVQRELVRRARLFRTGRE